jgi:hypothetical protein
LSTRIGVDIRQMDKLRQVADLSGVSFSRLSMALQGMTRRIVEASQGTGTAKDALKELGLSVDALMKMTPDEQFLAIAKALSEVDHAGKRVALTMKIFESEGVVILQMLPLLVNALRDVVSNMTEEIARSSEEFNDQMTKIRETFKQLAIKTIPTLNRALGILIENFREIATVVGIIVGLKLASWFYGVTKAFLVMTGAILALKVAGNILKVGSTEYFLGTAKGWEKFTLIISAFTDKILMLAKALSMSIFLPTGVFVAGLTTIVLLFGDAERMAKDFKKAIEEIIDLFKKNELGILERLFYGPDGYAGWKAKQQLSTMIPKGLLDEANTLSEHERRRLADRAGLISPHEKWRLSTKKLSVSPASQESAAGGGSSSKAPAMYDYTTAETPGSLPGQFASRIGDPSQISSAWKSYYESLQDDAKQSYDAQANALEGYQETVRNIRENLSNRERDQRKESMTQYVEYLKQKEEAEKEHAAKITAIQDELGQAFASGLSNAIFDFIDGTKTAGEAFKEFAGNFLRLVADMIIQQTILNALQYAGWGSGGSFATGGVFENGVKKFAQGGVVTKPTLFPMANGMGLMGEAGPEAVMPLRRGANGKLGVEASGGGGTQNIFLIQAMDSKSFVEFTKRNPQGILQPITRGINRGDRGLRGTMRTGALA